MTELRILIGPSASGKSTWAKNFVLKNEKWCIVSRDDLRYAWKNSGVVSPKLESIINKIIEDQIDTLTSAGFSIIYDATNLKAKYIRNIAKIVQHRSTVTYQIFDLPKDVCIERDSKRERSVGAEVIENQYKDYLVLLDSYDFGPIQPTVKKYVMPYVDQDKRPAYIFDIDGNLAHTSGKRSPYDYTKVKVDDVDIAVKRVLSELYDWADILIVSGREDSCYDDTAEWLVENNIPFSKLLMRKTGDQRKDAIIKEEIFWEHIEPKYNVIAVFDDRDQVVKMWRELGLKCFQSEYGNF